VALFIATVRAIAGLGAGQSCVIALAVFLLAIGLLAVAAFVTVPVINERFAFYLLFGFG
jgi:hypothetical protein